MRMKVIRYVLGVVVAIIATYLIRFILGLETDIVDVIPAIVGMSVAVVVVNSKKSKK